MKPMHAANSTNNTANVTSCSREMASRLPNNTLVIVLDDLVASELKNSPKPVASAKTVPVATSASDRRVPRTPMTSAPPTQNTPRPSATGRPRRTAPVAPGRPMWASAWGANAVLRTTTKYTMRPAARATIVPPASALLMNGEVRIDHQLSW